MNKVAIIHFYPPELYPPLQNLLTEISNREDLSVILLTNHAANSDLSVFEIKSPKIKIIRITKVSASQTSLIRYINYFLFYLIAIWKLVLFVPGSILYFETLSSFPALIYQRFFKKIKLYIHYHEYTSVEEYNKGMFLNRLFHRWERKVYPNADWLSHTNHFRMTMFEKDIFPAELSNKHILPNYPPKEWKSKPRQHFGDSLLVVYAGAFSLDTMYTREFANWVVNQQGRILWDIYSYNLTSQAHYFIRELNCPWIRLKRGIDYSELPLILKKYDVGVILYRGHIPNYIYNAPNKLFEYLACGLDVWFPDIMIGSMSFATKQTYPKVIPIDFENLDKMDFDQLLNREEYSIGENNYFYEVALEELLVKMTKNNEEI